MSTRRAWMCAVAAAGAFLPRAAPAEPLKRVGVLFFEGMLDKDPAANGFGLGMRELGYVDGRNVVIDYRYAKGRPERLAPMASELVHAKADVVLAGGPGPLFAARRATSTVPIVTVGGSDPVKEGWAQSLARARENRAQAVLAIETPFIVALRPRLVDAAARERLPVTGQSASSARTGS